MLLLSHDYNTGFAETGRLDVLANSLCRSTDVAALRARPGPFVAAGLRGLAQRQSPRGG